MRLPVPILLGVLLTLAACEPPDDATLDPAAQRAPVHRVGGTGPLDACDDDHGLDLPDGFCARVVAEVPGARHLAVRANGDLYVKLREVDGGGIVALRDTSGDYRKDVEARFGDFGGTGIRIHGGYLYAASNTALYRWPLESDGVLVPEGPPEAVVSGFPDQRAHEAKTFAFGPDGALYVNVGAPSNACQAQDRTPGALGQRPCPELERAAGIWRFPAGATGLTQADGERFATGIRHSVAIAYSETAGALYVVQHGRDQLHQLFPDRFTEEQSADQPAEEFLRVAQGANAGWPYCYWDWQLERRVLAPEYGGDGQAVGECDRYLTPEITFPGHFAPNDLLFYSAFQFPERYRGGAFVALHGSWNRAPGPQRGYKVAFIPMNGGPSTDDFEVFADGFAERPIASPQEAEFRPMGLALGPDGALFVADSRQGRIWRIVFVGTEIGDAADPAPGPAPEWEAVRGTEQ